MLVYQRVANFLPGIQSDFGPFYSNQVRPDAPGSPTPIKPDKRLIKDLSENRVPQKYHALLSFSLVNDSKCL